MPRITVIIVTFNSGRFIDRCLSALEAQTFRDFETVVVDNASNDGSVDRIRALHPGVSLIPCSSNLGFAAANNRGIEHAGGCQWIALLNPDAFPEPDWLERLYAAALAQPDFSFFGCCMKSADRAGCLDGTGDVYHVSGYAWRRDHGVPLEQGRYQPGEIFGPCAAAALYRKDALDEVRGFDESYFCYFEDVDLAFRLRLRSHRCWYVPDAVVHHVGSGIAGKGSDFAVYHGHRNLFWTYWKNMPWPLFWLYLPLHLAGNAAAILAAVRRGQFGVVLKSKLDALRGLPRILAERRRIQAGRSAKTRALRAVMASGLYAVMARSSS